MDNLTTTTMGMTSMQPNMTIMEGWKNNQHQWFFGICLPVFSVIGFLLNALIFVIFNHPLLQSSCAVYLAALAVADIGYLTTAMLIFSPETYLDEAQFSINFPNIFTRFYPCVEIMDVLVTLYILAALVDHCLFVFLPMQSAQWTQKERATTLVFAIMGSVVILYLLNFFQYFTEQYTMKDGTFIIQVCVSEIMANGAYRTWDKYMRFALFVCLAFLLYIVLIIRLCLARDTAKDHPFSGTQRVFKGGRSVKMLAAVAIWRLLFYIPTIVEKAAYYEAYPESDVEYACYVRPLDPAYTGLMPNYTVWSLFCNTFASTFRVVVYLIFARQWRRLLHRCVIECNWKGKPKKKKGKPFSQDNVVNAGPVDPDPPPKRRNPYDVATLAKLSVYTIHNEKRRPVDETDKEVGLYTGQVNPGYTWKDDTNPNEKNNGEKPKPNDKPKPDKQKTERKESTRNHDPKPKPKPQRTNSKPHSAESKPRKTEPKPVPDKRNPERKKEPRERKERKEGKESKKPPKKGESNKGYNWRDDAVDGAPPSGKSSSSQPSGYDWKATTPEYNTNQSNYNWKEPKRAKSKDKPKTKEEENKIKRQLPDTPRKSMDGSSQDHPANGFLTFDADGGLWI